jgi:hypothetical protein
MNQPGSFPPRRFTARPSIAGGSVMSKPVPLAAPGRTAVLLDRRDAGRLVLVCGNGAPRAEAESRSARRSNCTSCQDRDGASVEWAKRCRTENSRAAAAPETWLDTVKSEVGKLQAGGSSARTPTSACRPWLSSRVAGSQAVASAELLLDFKEPLAKRSLVVSLARSGNSPRAWRWSRTFRRDCRGPALLR